MQTASGASPFQVELAFFSGPLDLLLHLVRRAEVPISDVKMSVIADQYLEIIERAAEVDIDVATEYLVVAATLLAIKSESLLPGGGIGEYGEDDFEEGSDFYEQLRERLRRYEETKNRAQLLLARPQLGLSTFTRVDRQFLKSPQELVTDEKDLQTLPMLFVGLLKRIGKQIEGFVVRLDPIPLVDFMMRVVDAVQGIVGQRTSGNESDGMAIKELSNNGPRTFRGLIKILFLQARQKLPISSAEVSPAFKQLSKGTVIGSFMAVLELVKRGIVAARQEGENGEIEIQPRLQHVPVEQIQGQLIHGESLPDDSLVEEFYEPTGIVANAVANG